MNSVISLALMASVTCARLLDFDIHSNDIHAHLDRDLQPDHIAFYGDHHLSPDLDCSNLTSRDIHRRISAHVDRVFQMLSARDFESMVQEYPSILNVFGNNSDAITTWIRDFQAAIDKLEYEDLLLNKEEAADRLRHMSLMGLREIASHYSGRLPRRLSVENLRVLQADMFHAGVGSNLFQAVTSLVDCVHIDSLDRQVPSTDSLTPANVGYDIHQGQALQHENQASATMITDIDTLLSDPKLQQVFHPLGKTSENEPLEDPYFPYQWYLGGPPEQPYGGDFIRAWKFMTRSESFEGLDRTAFPASPRSGVLDLNVAIVDMGCGIHDDLLYDASNPICHNDNTKVGSIEEPAQDVIDTDHLSEVSKTGDKIEDHARHGADYCNQGPYETKPHLINEGHDTVKESYFKDPSNHGTSTASIIGAGWNDDSGISGLCPFCTVKCIKISADERNSTQVNMAGIFRSLEFLAAFNDSYPISNHSYGGFFLDPKEVEGHRRLSEAGHLAVTAAGNYGCDIDPLADAYGAFDADVDGIGLMPIHEELLSENMCKSNKGNAEAPMMPASVQYPTKMQVGAIGLNGDLSQFSNWGFETVSLMAPGETLVSLRARDADHAKSGNDEIIIQHGTSFAAPVASAAAAMIHRRMEQLCHKPDAAEIINILKDTVTPIDHLAHKVKSGGTLNVFEALKSIKNRC